MKQNLLEEINKMKMMFSYDNKKTLTENINLEEQRGALRDLIKVDREFLNANKSELENILSTSVGGLKDINGNSLKTADELLTAIKTDRLAPTALGKVNRGLLKSANTSREVKEAVAKDIGEFLYTKKADYAGATRSDMKDALIKQTKYTPEEAEMILKAYENKGGLFKDSKNAKDLEAAKDLERQKELEKLKEKNKKNDFERQKELEKLKEKNKKAQYEKEIEKYKVPEEKAGRWKKFKERIKKVGFVKGLLILGALGLAAYYLYDWFMNDDENVTFPDCLKNKVSKDDWDETIKNGQCLIINLTGNEQIDSIGGGKFYEDGKFKSGDDSQQGTWSDEGGNILIKIGGDEYILPCDGEAPNPDNDDLNLDDTFVENRPCGSFPFTVGCMNSYISDLNGCMGLGMGNTFTKELERELIKRGYGNSIDITIYNEIMKICGKKTIKPSSASSYVATLDI
jgi:hypothetical protein